MGCAWRWLAAAWLQPHGRPVCARRLRDLLWRLLVGGFLGWASSLLCGFSDRICGMRANCPVQVKRGIILFKCIVTSERSRKRKIQKKAYEAENSKKSKVEEVARQSKGKAAAQDLQVHEPRRPTGIQIREPSSQPSSLHVSQQRSLVQRSAPASKPRSAKVQRSAATPFVPPKQVTNLPQHCFNLAAYKEAKKGRAGPPV
nr:uncharacterized protein LOC120966603 isoform X2 [Aegilops tauschii subsp. strangulata]